MANLNGQTMGMNIHNVKGMTTLIIARAVDILEDNGKARLRKVKLEIEIDEGYIAELVSKEIARRIVETHGYENREARIGIRNGVDKAIKQYIYSKKDTIIDRVVDRATVEIVKKGLPKLLEKAIATDVKEVNHEPI